MCGRFCIAATPGDISERFGVETPESFRPCYNIAPGHNVLILMNKNGLFSDMAEWGIKTGKSGRIINTRVERITDTYLFGKMHKTERCLIPADGYYEWEKRTTGTIPYYFSPKNGEIITFAGLTLDSPDNRQIAIITTDAFEDFKKIHPRMPLIIGQDAKMSYLTGSDILSIPLFPEADLQKYEVSRRVNRADEDGPDLILPYTGKKEQRTLFCPDDTD